MRIAKIEPRENERLAAVAEYEAGGSDFETNGEPGLKEIADLAASMFDVPVALVTLVDRTATVFAAASGIDLCGVDRDISFCSHALGSEDLLVVPDATCDPRFAGNPLVVGDGGFRFYAGAPLRGPSDAIIGTLCLLDTRSRSALSAQQRRNLKNLAALALDKLENRRLRLASEVGLARFQSIAANSPDGIVCADGQGRVSYWNATAERLFGYTAAEALGASWDVLLPLETRAMHTAAFQRITQDGAPLPDGRTLEVDAVHKSGRPVPIELSLFRWREHGAATVGAIMRDITERREREDQLFHLAHHDALTALPNRAVLFRRIAEAIGRDEPSYVLLTDLDGFKRVNDGVGHRGGDLLLKQAAQRLLLSVPEASVVARLSGDEFAVLVRTGSDPDAPAAAADAIISAMTAPFQIDGQPVHIGASVGIAVHPDHGATAEELVSNAELALSQAKREGRRCRRIFTHRLRDNMGQRFVGDGEVRRAIDNVEFELFYQPQINLIDGRVLGAEALIRWRHPSRGLLVPADFLQTAEDGLLAADVGTWVLETACAQAFTWHRRYPGFRVGVNLFEAQFGTGTLVSQVRSILHRTGLPPSGLELEVTENTILRHDGTMLKALEALHAEGVGVAFDDFGTGYASLSMLRTYPLSRLKIDRSFVSGSGVNRVDSLIVTAVAALGNGMGLDVIAEGIETEAQRDLVRAIGCRSGQGFLFGEAMPAPVFDRWMRDRLETMPLRIGG